MIDYIDRAQKLLKKLLESQCDLEDKRWQIVGDILQEGCLRNSDFRFIERYNRAILDFHLHGSLVFNGGNNGRDRRWKFCAILERGPDKSTIKGRMRENMPAVYRDDGRIKAAMFVDIRELTQLPKNLGCRIPSVVRLQALNECMCTIGNPLKHGLFSEQNVFWNGRTMTSGLLHQKRKLALTGNGVGQGLPVIPFDKFEKQVIECRPELVNHFTSKEGDVSRGFSSDAQCFFAVRISNDLVRLTSCVFGNALIDELTMVECPGKFPASGLNGEAFHEKENSKDG